MRVLGQRRLWSAAHRDDPDLEPRDGRQNSEQFFRLAARTQSEHHIAVGDHAQIAMQRV